MATDAPTISGGAHHKALAMKKVVGKPGEVWYPLQILSVPTPTPTATQLLLRPTHLSLNHRDVFLRQHLYPSPSFTTPLLSDAVCEVLVPASHPPSPAAPRRVLLLPGHGWTASPFGPEAPYAILGGTAALAQGAAQARLVAGADAVVACPPHLSGAEAAALPLAGLTAWRALVAKSGGAHAPGSNVLVTGAGGGVALAVLLFAVAMRVNVWVTSADPAKIERAVRLGARGGVRYSAARWDRDLAALLPPERPWLDAVIDGAGGDIVARTVRLLKPGGVIVSYGMTVGPTLPVPMVAVMKNVDVRGTMMGSRREFEDMVAFVAEHRIRPVVSRVVEAPLDDLGAWEGLWADMKAGRQFGKLVFAVREGRERGTSRL